MNEVVFYDHYQIKRHQEKIKSSEMVKCAGEDLTSSLLELCNYITV